MSTRAQVQSFGLTSKELGARQRQVLNFLRDYPLGLSAWQLAELSGRFVHAVRPRLTELHALGLIRQTGERFEERTKRLEAVWALVLAEENGQLLIGGAA